METGIHVFGFTVTIVIITIILRVSEVSEKLNKLSNEIEKLNKLSNEIEKLKNGK
jgi:Cys-tRNA synthase (O-phospho-L-seryl-tRNA:Cys-tRNA synthase)